MKTTSPILAEILGVSTRYISDLEKEGVIIRVARGQYDVRKSVKNYIAILKAKAEPVGVEAELRAAKLRKALADAELAEIAVAKEAGALVLAKNIERTWSTAISNARTRLLTLPARLGPQAVLAASAQEATAIIDREMRLTLTELSESDPLEGEA